MAVDPGVRTVNNTSITRVAISHRSILPPIWATLPTDAHLYERPVASFTVPDRIMLDADGRCICGASRVPDNGTVFLPCKVYGLTTVHTCEIELQPCNTCPRAYRRYVGPDGREKGIFNWNNKLLFTHDLLDDYTASFTSSETPFTAWMSVVQRRYIRYASPEPFVRRDDVFLAAWFAYSNVQAMDGDMSCPGCGPTPDNVIWDGVSLSFHRKHLLPTLRPPTVVNENSLERQSKRISQSLIKSAEVRRNMQKVIDAAGTTKGEAIPSLGQLTDHFGLIQATTSALREINQELGDYFNSHYGIEMLASERRPSSEISQLFRQVRGSCSFTSIWFLSWVYYRSQPTTQSYR